MNSHYQDEFLLEFFSWQRVHQRQVRHHLNQIEQLENEEILLSIRVSQSVVIRRLDHRAYVDVPFVRQIEQVESQSNHFQSEIEQMQMKRNQLIDQIERIDEDLLTAKQTLEQRHSIVQDKVSVLLRHCSFSLPISLSVQLIRIDQMSTRRNQLERFIHVFHFKIRQLTSQMDPRQNECRSLMDLFNNVGLQPGI